MVEKFKWNYSNLRILNKIKEFQLKFLEEDFKIWLKNVTIKFIFYELQMEIMYVYSYIHKCENIILQ